MPRFLPFLLFIPLVVFAQEKGIRFENDLNWPAVQAKAKAEHKYIFMDCYTTWCGPCRYMAREIFPQQAAGSYFNDKFVSVAVQLDTAKNDDARAKGWYADAHDLAEKYHVRAYPTYLIFAPDGHVVHRLVGSRGNVDKFIADVAESFDSTKQYYTLLGQYENGRCDSAFLRMLTIQCLQVYDVDQATAVGHAYLGTQTNLYQPGVLQILDRVTTKSTDPYFAFLADHTRAIDSILGAGKAESKIRAVFLNEGAGKAGENQAPDWAGLRARIATRLPADADELTERIKVDYYRRKKDWSSFDKVFTGYMKNYSSHMPDDVLNSIAWNVFENCADMTCVGGVLDCTKRLRDSPEPAYIDTYANILYKLGKKADAIALEEKAMNAAAEADKAGFQQTIAKMRQNQTTW